MTRKEAMRQTMQRDNLRSLGFTYGEAEKLRRISMTLHRWHEMECGTDGGCIERDEATGKAFWLTVHGTRYQIADRETGARKRLAAILEAANDRRARRDTDRQPLASYIQTDPRGAALYILRPGDVPEGKEPESYYSRGLCVY
jgi:hypothetical protein